MNRVCGVLCVWFCVCGSVCVAASGAGEADPRYPDGMPMCRDDDWCEHDVYALEGW